jgi:riboflavin kinase/FMN adenylyltransferase
MQIIRNNNLIQKLNNINEDILANVAVIGNFDGLHLGHQALINKAQEVAKIKNIKKLLITFEPHPLKFFDKVGRIKLAENNFRINSLSQKLRIIKNYQFDYVVILPFNSDLSNIEAKDFLEKILIKRLNIRHLVIGYDFIFGKNRQGNFEFLEKEGKTFGLAIDRIEQIKYQNQICSSTNIRNLIREGEIAIANQLLGRNFAINGIVVNGNHNGSKIGFPTANIKINPSLLYPKFGVYETIVKINNQKQYFSAITNFGIRPTFNNDNILQPVFESHIFNFNQNIYHQKISIELIKFIRMERKFNNITELKQQIKIDINQISIKNLKNENYP